MQANPPLIISHKIDTVIVGNIELYFDTTEIIIIEKMNSDENDTLKGKRIGVSGYGNVAWGIMKKAAELGAKVTYMSGPDGYAIR